MKKSLKIIIVGAGPVGCVLAERLTTILGLEVTIFEHRNHIAGNCYDYYSNNGVLSHAYGPHYFRTNKKEILEYLSQFTEWIEGNYIVTSLYNNQHFPFPINLNTIRLFSGNKNMTESEAKYWIDQQKQDIPNPKNSEEFVLSRVGKEMYEAFYLGYTIKQWNRHPRDLSPTICGRIPIRFNEDNRYVDEKFQLTPKNGFTEMFQKMISNEKINLKLNTTFDKKNEIADIVIYSGPIDTYFDYCFGKLDWRSIRFEFIEMQKEFHQQNVQINYPNNFDYTRSVEIKHVTKQNINATVVSYEYPTNNGEPFYPILNIENEERYLKYKQLALQETIEKNVHFCGRLAEYTYYNTDQVIEKALDLFDKIKQTIHHE